MKKLFSLAAIMLAIVMLFGTVAYAADAANAGDSSAESAGESSEDAVGESEGDSSEDAMGESAGESSEDAAAGESTGESSGDSSGMMSMFITAFGLEEYADFDWEGFYADLDARVEAGEEVTLEEAFPDAFWAIFEAMFASQDGEEEMEGVSIDVGCEDNEIYMNYVFEDVVSAEDSQVIVDSVKEQFESEESKANLKQSIEQMAEAYKIDITTIKMTLRFVNGDESIIYEKIFTYEELAAEVPEAGAEAEMEAAG